MIFTLGSLYFILLGCLCAHFNAFWTVFFSIPPGGAVFVASWAGVMSTKKKAMLEADGQTRESVFEIVEDLDEQENEVWAEMEHRFNAEGWFGPESHLNSGLPVPGNLNGDELPPANKRWKQLLVASGLIRRSAPKTRSKDAVV
jgi:hypothetical protein